MRGPETSFLFIVSYSFKNGCLHMNVPDLCLVHLGYVFLLLSLKDSHIDVVFFCKQALSWRAILHSIRLKAWNEQTQNKE